MPISERPPAFDLYAELGVTETADRPTIEAAYRALLRRHHPDLAGGDRRATRRTQRLNVARDWLTDPARRASYDTLRRPPRPAPLPPTGPGRPRRGPGGRAGAWTTGSSDTRTARPPTADLRGLVAIAGVVLGLLGLLAGIGGGVVGPVAFGLGAVLLGAAVALGLAGV